MIDPRAPKDLFQIVIDGLFSTPAPPTLYHYTTSVGLNGMMTEKKIWASHVRYLNDLTEYSLAFQYAEETIKSDATLTAKYPRVPELVKQLFKHVKKAEVYVISLSDDGGNRLSQWRGYCQSGGYSVGFRSSHLIGICGSLQSTTLNAFLTSCIYGEAAIKLSIAQLVEKLKEKLDEHAPAATIEEGVQMLTGLLGEFAWAVALLATRSKHEGFDEEREWRLIIRQTSSVPADILGFHSRGASLVPHLEIPLTIPSTSTIPGASQLSVDSIRVGPTPHPDEAVRSVEMLLVSSGVQCSQVKTSNIPFRSW